MQEHTAIQKVLDYIDENVASPITAQELSRQCHYSLYHFYRLFENATGMPVIKYILRRRLLFAAWEMANGTSVTDAALRYGFDTAAGFYKAFKREMGIPPSRFASHFHLRKPLPIKLAQEAHVMIPLQKIRSLLRHWHLEGQPVSPVIFQPSGYVSDSAWWIGDDHVLKCYLNPAALKLNAQIASALHTHGFKAPLHVPTAKNEPFIQDGEMCFALTKRVQSQRRKAVCEQDALTLGRAIGRLHLILQSEDSILCREQDVFQEVKDVWLSKAAAALSLSGSFVEDYLQTIDRLKPHMPVHIIHRDPNPDNMLWQGDDIIGFVDFDLTQKSARLFDVCYAATAILCEIIDDEKDKLAVWPRLVNSIAQGYNCICPLTDAEKEALPYMMLTVQMICVGYFSTVDKFRDLCDKNVRMTRFILHHLNELKLS